MNEADARAAAEGTLDGADAVFGDAYELASGWFFPCVRKSADIYHGVIVNKSTGRSLPVLRQSPMANDLDLYDRGYQFEAFDLVVLEVDNMEAAVQILHALHEVTVDTYYKNDRVYRVGRNLTEMEVRERLSNLPCVFSGHFAFGLAGLERARVDGVFAFKVFEYRGKP